MIKNEQHKNFQLWNHMHELALAAGDLQLFDVLKEQYESTEGVLEIDDKNYHLYDFLGKLVCQIFGYKLVTFRPEFLS